jgi:hypothetical protein
MGGEPAIGEQIVLLALDEETGRLREAPLRVSLAVAAGALAGLALSGHVVLREGAFTVARASAPADPVAAVLVQHLREHPGDEPRAWLLAVRERALAAAYEGLLARRVVRERGRRVLGAFGTVTYPVVVPQARAALLGRLDAVLARGQDPDARTAALITVLHHAGLHALLPTGAGADADATAARRAAVAALAEGQASAAALGETVRTTVASIAAVVAASGGTA